jgi:hypothetical protein
MNFFQQLFSPDFMPHGYCYMWDPRIVWLHVISDSLIAVALRWLFTRSLCVCKAPPAM